MSFEVWVLKKPTPYNYYQIMWEISIFFAIMCKSQVCHYYQYLSLNWQYGGIQTSYTCRLNC